MDISESPWTPGYSEALDAEILPEMPFLSESAYANIAAALETLHDILSTVTEVVNNVITTDVYMPLPSGLLVKIYAYNEGFTLQDFKLPPFERKIVHFNLLWLRYSAHLFPGQDKWVNLFYIPRDLTLIAHDDSRFTSGVLKWKNDDVGRAYELLDASIDISATTLVLGFLTFLINKGFSMLQTWYDSILHGKIDSLIQAQSNNSAVDAEQLTRLKRLYAGAYH